MVFFFKTPMAWGYLTSNINSGLSAKSSSKWGSHELDAFNIKVVEVDAEAFFGTSVLPEATVSSIILNNLEAPTGTLTKAETDFFGYLGEAMTYPPGQESPVDDFAIFLLRMMGFDEDLRRMHIRKPLKFEMCGQHKGAIPNICIKEYSGVRAMHVLFIQENKVCKPCLCLLKIYLPVTC